MVHTMAANHNSNTRETAFQCLKDEKASLKPGATYLEAWRDDYLIENYQGQVENVSEHKSIVEGEGLRTNGDLLISLCLALMRRETNENLQMPWIQHHIIVGICNSRVPCGSLTSILSIGNLQKAAKTYSKTPSHSFLLPVLYSF